MKTGVNDVFNALLFGLPQGILLTVIWVAYSVWLAVTMRRFVPVWSPRQFTAFVSMSRHTARSAPQPTREQTEQHI